MATLNVYEKLSKKLNIKLSTIHEIVLIDHGMKHFNNGKLVKVKLNAKPYVIKELNRIAKALHVKRNSVMAGLIADYAKNLYDAQGNLLP